MKRFYTLIIITVLGAFFFAISLVSSAFAAADLTNVDVVVMGDSRWGYDNGDYDGKNQGEYADIASIGVDAILLQVEWFEFEPTEGNFDFEKSDDHYNCIIDAGMQCFFQIAVAGVPSWLYAKDQNFYWWTTVGAQAGLGGPPNFFHPDTQTYVTRAINAFCDHYSSAGLIFVSSGYLGESYYPSGAFFDSNTVAAWRSYTGDSSAYPYAYDGDPGGSGGTYGEFETFLYAKMDEYIAYTSAAVHAKLPSCGIGIKLGGPYQENEVLAAQPYGLQVVSFGGPLSSGYGSYLAGKYADDYGLSSWVETSFRNFAGETNTIEETKKRIADYNISSINYGTMLYLLSEYNIKYTEYYKLEEFINSYNAGFEDWPTSYWTTSTSSGSAGQNSSFHKAGDNSLQLFASGSGSAEAYHTQSYSSGSIILNGYRYLSSLSGAGSIYWLVTGYDGASVKKYQGVYWTGNSNPELDTATAVVNGGFYSIKIELDDAAVTNQWIYSGRLLNQDLDNVFGPGTWSSLGITSLRVTCKAWATGSVTGYFDEVTLSDSFARGQNTGFELGSDLYWVGSGNYEVTNALAKTGTYSLKLSHSGGTTTEIYQQYLYTYGNVTLNAQRYLESYYGSVSLYWKLLGYGADDELKFQGVYWSGSTNEELDNQQSGGVYYYKIQLGNSASAGSWQRVYRTANEDLDGIFGSGTWDDLGVVRVRLYNCVGGTGSLVAYVDDVQLLEEGDLGAPFWYLAEGTTIGSFGTWILIMNPNDEVAENVYVTFMKEDGTTVQTTVTVGVESRHSIYANDYVEDASFSTKVESANGVGLIVERAMYWMAGGQVDSGGHATRGVTEPKHVWYLAEGTTTGTFDTWVLIQNPNSSTAEVLATFMLEDGSNITRSIDIGATSRYTIHVNSIVDNAPVSTKIESTNGVSLIAERAMYWDVPGLTEGADPWTWGGGHATIGANETAINWYFAEGSTNPGMDEYILVMNPNTEEAAVRVTYMFDDGSTQTQSINVGATSRYTINVNAIAPNKSLSVKVESLNGVGIISERAMYWESEGRAWFDGHVTIGNTDPARTWYLAEGSTSGMFEEWVLIMNPNDEAAEVTVTFMVQGGENVVQNITVGATSRYTISVDSIIADASLATKIESTNGVPVVAERAMYWEVDDQAWVGGHVSVGYGNI